MLEALLLDAVGWWFLAAASHRYRKEAGKPDARSTRLLRALGAVALVVPWLVALPDASAGRRIVALVLALSLVAGAVALALSAWAGALLAPIRLLTMRAVGRERG